MVDFIRWANTSKTAIYIEAPEVIAEQDIPNIITRINQLVKSTDSQLDLIIDRSKTTNVPRKMLIVMGKVISKNNYRQIVLIGFAMLPKMLVETLTRLAGVFQSDPIFVDTLAEAYDKLGITDPVSQDTYQA